MDAITISNIAISALLFVSELLPFIRSNDYNGIVDLVIKFIGKIRRPTAVVATEPDEEVDDTVIIE
jgi:hypothetical protein